jgi:hypothetical protein
MTVKRDAGSRVRAIPRQPRVLALSWVVGWGRTTQCVPNVFECAELFANETEVEARAIAGEPFEML